MTRPDARTPSTPLPPPRPWCPRSFAVGALLWVPLAVASLTRSAPAPAAAAAPACVAKDVAPARVVPVAPVVVVAPQQTTARPVQIRWGEAWYPGEILRPYAGPYFLVRFDGYGDEWDVIVHENDLHPRGQTPPPAWQPETPGLPLAESHALRRGQALLADWHGSWYPVHVLRVSRDGATARIRYDGYGSEWDEDVTRERLRARDPSRDGPAPEPVTNVPSEVPDARVVLHAGQPVVARMGPAWRRATVVALEQAGLVRVHYLGYSRAYDEVVPRDRLRIAR